MTGSDTLLRRLPVEVRQVARRLLDEPLRSPAALREGVVEHLELLEREHRRNEFLDLVRAREVAARCLRLLDGLAEAEADGARPDREPPDPEIHRLVQVAARYFTIEDDADDDLSLDGIDDDAAVVAAVEALLGVAR